MAKRKKNVLCIDIGGDTIKAAEFAYSDTGVMTLVKFAFAEFGFGENSATENDSYLYAMLIELKKLLEENHYFRFGSELFHPFCQDSRTDGE